MKPTACFFNVIADAINYHNDQIRQKAVEDFKEFINQKDESESEDETEDESEMVVETVTETVSILTVSDNKLVKSILDAATITGLVAGIGWIGKKKQSKKTSQPIQARVL